MYAYRYTHIYIYIIHNDPIQKNPSRAFSRYQSDVAALTVFGFDAAKLDGCGRQKVHIQWAISAGNMTTK